MPNLVKVILKVLFSASAIFFVLQKIDKTQLTLMLNQLQVTWLLPALILFAMSKYFSAERLRIYFTNAGVSIDRIFNLKLYLLGMFYNTVLPGGVGGDGYKVWVLKKSEKYGETKSKDLIFAVLLDRVIGLIILVLIILILLSVYQFSWIFPLAFLLTISATLLIYKLFFSSFELVIPALLSGGVQLAQIFCVVFIIQSLDLGYTHLPGYIIIFLISSVASAVPVSIGGVGLRELVFLYLTPVMSLPAENGILVALLFFLITFLVSLSGIYFLFNPLVEIINRKTAAET